MVKQEIRSIVIKFQKADREPFSLDLVPMINIVFLLLIFFMLTSSAMKSSLDVDLPKASSSNKISGKNLIIKINKDGNFEFEDKVIGPEKLISELKSKLAIKKGLIVEIYADKSIKFESFGKIIKLAREAGASEFIFATENVASPIDSHLH